MRALLLVLPVIGLACADGQGPGATEDERVLQIRGVAELATYAYASHGADGLYDYLAPSVLAGCSPTELAAALADKELPSGFRDARVVELNGGEAIAEVTLLYGDEARTERWRFALTAGGLWRLTGIPGMEECAN
jgi:hypothetical protein